MSLCFLSASCLGSLACDFAILATSPAHSRRPVSADVATVRPPFVPHCAFPSLTSLRPAVPRPAPSSLLAAFRRAASLRFHASGLVHTAVIQTAVPSGGGVLLAGWRHRAEGCGALRVHRCSLRSRKSGRSWFGQVSRRYATCRPSLRSARMRSEVRGHC